MRLTSHPDLKIPNNRTEIGFHYNGKVLTGREGDTVASALFANGVRIFSRSFKYHRPRGLYDAQGLGSEVLLTVNGEANVPADRVPLREGMQVSTQNAWPSVDFDMMAINQAVVPKLPNGFYYKMFHKPKGAWPYFEKAIRRAAGLGKVDPENSGENDRYEKRYLFPDVCVIGGGPAGLAAALAAAEQQKQVLLIESQPALGGHSRHSIRTIQNGMKEYEAVEELAKRIEAQANIKVLLNATAFAVYEDNLIGVQQGKDLFKIRAGATVLAPGASDRDLVFENNDLPGIMTGRGVERMIGLYGVQPGKTAVVVTTHEGGYHTARLLRGAGVEVAAIVDARQDPPKNSFHDDSIPVHSGQTILQAKGKKHVKEVILGPVDSSTPGPGAEHAIQCDLAVIAVGYKPHLSLLSMGRNKPSWDSTRKVFRVKDLPEGIYVAGEVEGHTHFNELVKEGIQAGKEAALKKPATRSVRHPEDAPHTIAPDIERHGKNHFICKCMDVTRTETTASIAEGFDQIETLKRYTSMGMGRCQGKGCYESAARLAAIDTGRETAECPPTTVRPPFEPVSFGVLAGRAPYLVPQKRTPIHHAHEASGAKFLDAGAWKRPEFYTDPQEEAREVRNGLGIVDVSTLGKMEISGKDALDFLHFMMPSKFKKLAVGRTRYCVMVGEDGILFEDGTISHVEEGRYYLTTTTGNQEAIDSRFQWWLTTENFNVHFKNVSNSFAAVNVAGMESRNFLQTLVDIDMTNEEFPYMHCRKTQIAGVPVWLFRIGFTGELGFEIHYPAEYGKPLWDFLMEKGAPYNLKPFGIEAQRILRLEKGHLIPGVDTDGLSNPFQAGVGFAIKADKPDFIGKTFLENFKDRGIEERLVSYKLKSGAKVPDDGVAILHDKKIIGRVTSSRQSPNLGHGVGLCWVKDEFAAEGSSIQIRRADGQDVEGIILKHGAFDPEGGRLKS